VEQKRKNLCDEIDTINISDKVVRTMSELMYTAYETDILPFKMHSDDITIVVKLSLLSIKCQLPPALVGSLSK